MMLASAGSICSIFPAAWAAQTRGIFPVTARPPAAPVIANMCLREISEARMGSSRGFDEASPAVPDVILSRERIQLWVGTGNLDLPSLLPPSRYALRRTGSSYAKAGRVRVV